MNFLCMIVSGAMLIPANTYGDRAPFWFGGGRRAHKERIEAVHAGDFTQLRAAWMRKTLLLLVCVYWIFAQEG